MFGKVVAVMGRLTFLSVCLTLSIGPDEAWMVSNRRTNLLEAAAKRLGLVGDQDRWVTGLSSWYTRDGGWGEVTDTNSNLMDVVDEKEYLIFTKIFT